MHSSENSTPNTSSDYPYYKSYHSSPSEIPFREEWYHGELTENDATRLIHGSQSGTFLIRSNGAGRYYLSIVDDQHFVKHLPISQINSSFFFNGTRYESLGEIVAIYQPAAIPFHNMLNSQSNKNDFPENKYLCTTSYEAKEVDEINAEVGDILSLVETNDPAWLMGRNEANGVVGLVPVTNVQPLIMAVENLNELIYFYDTVSIDMVQISNIGAFLLRRSSKGTDTFALLVKTQYDLVEKFLIVGSPTQGFFVAGRPFATIGHVLNRYSERAISGGVRLTHAVCCNKQKKESKFMKEEITKNNKNVISMCSSHYDEKKPQKSRRMFRGASIDTALASGSYLSTTAMTSPANTVSTNTAETLADRYNYEEYSESLETTSTVIASTSASRKSREEKQWKECWITLSDMSCGSSQLAIFDSMSSKRRQTIDLSSCTLFWLDESVFSVDGCIFLSSTYPQSSPIYLCFRPFSVFLKWVRLLRNRSIFQDVPPPISQTTINYNEPTSQMSLLSVEIEKYRSESLKSDTCYSANVLLNGVKVCSSNCFAPAGNKGTNDLPVVIIDSKFILPCIPTCSTSIQLAINSHSSAGKRGRPCGVSALVSLPEPSISQVDYVPPSEIGFFFKAQKYRFPILPIERYRPLIEAIHNSPTELFRWPSQLLTHSKKIFLYSCISYLYTADPVNMSNVFRRIIDDVLATSTAEDVFRKDSLATGIMTQCLRHLMKTQFDEFLQENAVFCQAVKQQIPNNNIDNVVEILVNFVDQRLMTIPLAIRLLVVAADSAQKRFVDEPHLVKRTLSALLILRVLNPIIFSTLNNGIGSQLAKSVQTCANVAASRVSDEELTGPAATIRRIFDRMIILVDKNDECEDRTGNGEIGAEWLSCIAHLIGSSLSQKPANSTVSLEEENSPLPLSVLELVRLHQ